ncbi:hypothetical protein D1007_16983 [Hordeum vulgare]|nr:hypothetical protein D1007_16983 [Hordeum vulgare]
MTEMIMYILAKKEEACVRRSEIKEEDKAQRFKQKLVVEERRTMIEERKAALEEKRVKIATNAEDAKMLTFNVDARVIVQSYGHQMLHRQKDELAVADYEDAAEAATKTDKEAANAAMATRP